MGRRLRVVNLGRTNYRACWDLQRKIHAARMAGTAPDTFLLTEHDNVYTIGRGGNPDHLLAGADTLAARGIDVVENDRGGDITYHGPGQLVGYPILDLRNHRQDLHRYLRDLEEVVIRALAGCGVNASRHPSYTGVWVGGDKICAIGVKTVSWVTMHGFALNVSTDLSYFGSIIPCGIFERGVTSMRETLGCDVPMPAVAAAVVEAFGIVFETAFEWSEPEALFEAAGDAHMQYMEE